MNQESPLPPSKTPRRSETGTFDPFDFAMVENLRPRDVRKRPRRPSRSRPASGARPSPRAANRGVILGPPRSPVNRLEPNGRRGPGCLNRAGSRFDVQSPHTYPRRQRRDGPGPSRGLRVGASRPGGLARGWLDVASYLPCDRLVGAFAYGLNVPSHRPEQAKESRPSSPRATNPSKEV